MPDAGLVEALASEACRQWNAAGNPHLSTGAIGVARIAARLALTQSPLPREGEWVTVLDCHDSDCAIHNMPAEPNGQCNCWIASARELQAQQWPDTEDYERFFSRYGPNFLDMADRVDTFLALSAAAPPSPDMENRGDEPSSDASVRDCPAASVKSGEPIPVNSPWERVPVCACDLGCDNAPSRQQQMECRLRGGPCSPGFKGGDQPDQEPDGHDPWLKETWIADEEAGPCVGLLVERPDGVQVWSGEVSRVLFDCLSDEEADEIRGGSHRIVVAKNDGSTPAVVANAVSVDAGAEIVRALAAYLPVAAGQSLNGLAQDGSSQQNDIPSPDRQGEVERNGCWSSEAMDIVLTRAEKAEAECERLRERVAYLSKHCHHIACSRWGTDPVACTSCAGIRRRETERLLGAEAQVSTLTAQLSGLVEVSRKVLKALESQSDYAKSPSGEENKVWDPEPLVRALRTAHEAAAHNSGEGK